MFSSYNVMPMKKNVMILAGAGQTGMAIARRMGYGMNEVANIAELLMRPQGAFITGADFLIDGGATASYFYGPLQPHK